MLLIVPPSVNGDKPTAVAHSEAGPLDALDTVLVSADWPEHDATAISYCGSHDDNGRRLLLDTIEELAADAEPYSHSHWQPPITTAVDGRDLIVSSQPLARLGLTVVSVLGLPHAALLVVRGWLPPWHELRLRREPQ